MWDQSLLRKPRTRGPAHAPPSSKAQAASSWSTHPNTTTSTHQSTDCVCIWGLGVQLEWGPSAMKAFLFRFLFSCSVQGIARAMLGRQNLPPQGPSSSTILEPSSATIIRAIVVPWQA